MWCDVSKACASTLNVCSCRPRREQSTEAAAENTTHTQMSQAGERGIGSCVACHATPQGLLGASTPIDMGLGLGLSLRLLIAMLIAMELLRAVNDLSSDNAWIGEMKL